MEEDLEKADNEALRVRVLILERMVEELLAVQVVSDPLFDHAIKEMEVRRQFKKIADGETDPRIRTRSLALDTAEQKLIESARRRSIHYR